MSTLRRFSAARPERASASVSSSIAVISSIVAIIRARSASGSTLSARMRSEAKGVRKSWPIAPSIRSFSSNIAETRALIALKARIARRTSSGPRGSTRGGAPGPPKPSAAAVRSRSGRASRIAIQIIAARIRK